MNHEKIFTREDKSKVKITVRMWMDGFGSSGLKYDIDVSTKAPKKRLWNTINFSDDYTYRALSMSGRRIFLKEQQLRIVSAIEIHEAKLEAWELIKPTIGD